MSADNPYSSPNEIKPQFNSPGMPLPQSGLAIGSMVVGIIALVLNLPFCCCGPIVALITVPLGIAALAMGYMAKQECDKGLKSGGGMALAGMICGGIALAFGVLMGILMAFGIAMNVGQGLQNNQNF